MDPVLKDLVSVPHTLRTHTHTLPFLSLSLSNTHIHHDILQHPLTHTKTYICTYVRVQHDILH